MDYPPANVDLTHLRAFVAVADHRHFGEAAKALHVTQPALSRRIQALEEATGGPLFQRNAREVRLTPAGDALYREAPALLERFAEALATTRAVHAGDRGCLRVGYTSLALATLLPCALQRLRAAFPDVDLRLREGASRPLLDDLRAARIDLAFPLHAPPDEDPGLAATPVLTESIGLVVPAAHPLAKGDEPVPLAALANEPLILFPRHLNPALYDGITSACRDAGFTARIVAEVTPREAAIAAVAAGQGVTFLTPALKHLAIGGTVHRELAPPAPVISCFMAWRREESPALRRWRLALFPEHASASP